MEESKLYHMKIFKIIWGLISILVLAFIIINLFNAYVSFKYEIEEPKSMGYISDLLLQKENHFKQLIFWLWLFLIISIGNILFIIIGVFSKFGEDSK